MLIRLLREDSGQAGLEYMLAMGVVAVVVAAALVLGFVAITQGILPVLCHAVDPLGSPAGSGNCITIGP